MDAPKEWTQAIIDQTKNLPQIPDACILRVTFLLPPDKFPSDLRFGPDLDNLLKRFLDALGKTCFARSLGGDSCVISLHASKAYVESKEEAGAALEIVPVIV